MPDGHNVTAVPTPEASDRTVADLAAAAAGAQAAVDQAEAALADAKSRRTTILANLADLAREAPDVDAAWHIYWETELPAYLAAAFLGLPKSHASSVAARLAQHRPPPTRPCDGTLIRRNGGRVRGGEPCPFGGRIPQTSRSDSRSRICEACTEERAQRWARERAEREASRTRPAGQRRPRRGRITEAQEGYVRSLLAQRIPGADADAEIRRINESESPQATVSVVISTLKGMGIDDVANLDSVVSQAPDSPDVERLRSMPYQEYLRTDHWRRMRAGALRRSGYACQVCSAKIDLNVHHRTYERRGCELDSDLTVLCRQCHATFHGKDHG